MHLICASAKGAVMLSRREARSCSQYSITRNVFARLLPTATWTRKLCTVVCLAAFHHSNGF